MMASEIDIDYINNAAILVENKPLSMSIYGWLAQIYGVGRYEPPVDMSQS
jgi:hypothetical protein